MPMPLASTSYVMVMGALRACAEIRTAIIPRAFGWLRSGRDRTIFAWLRECGSNLHKAGALRAEGYNGTTRISGRPTEASYV